ncbi:MAG: P-loop NTPase fold protein [Xenococcaceae cyanobacterium]
MAETEQSKTVTIGARPAKEDTLGFKPYVIAIAKFLTAPDTKPPLTISIEGEWGRGKSSFMEQLQEQILQEYEELEELEEEQQLKNAPWFKKGFLWVKFKFRQKT